MFLPPFRANARDTSTSTEDAIATAQQALDRSYPAEQDIDVSFPADPNWQPNPETTAIPPVQPTTAPTKIRTMTIPGALYHVEKAKEAKEAKEAPQLPSFSASTQEILRRHGMSPNIATDSPEYLAARRQVLESMAAAPNENSPRASMDYTNASMRGRGRGRGRPPNTMRLGVNGGTTRADLAVKAEEGALGSPSVRGKNRGGRPRGSRGTRGRGGRKRKRDSDDEGGGGSSSGEDDDPETPKAPTVTKSGRSVQKPSSYTPVVTQASPTTNRTPTSASQTHANPFTTSTRGRGGRKSASRKDPQLALCAKCLRGHSPESNVIVFCDGCNTPWHQWCHAPHITRDVVEVADKAWFCSKCAARREEEQCPLDSRVSGIGWSEQERREYLDGLGAEMLRALMFRALKSYPDAPVFPPRGDGKAAEVRNIEGLPSEASADRNRTEGTATSSALTPLEESTPAPVPPPTNTAPTHNPLISATNHLQAAQQQSKEDEDPYPDITLAAATNDPPSTYPRPGHGPIAVQPTTREDDMRWLVDDEKGFGVFSHFYDGGAEGIDDGSSGMQMNGEGKTGPVNAGVVEGLMNVAGTGEVGVKGGWIRREGV